MIKKDGRCLNVKKLCVASFLIIISLGLILPGTVGAG